MYLDGSYTLKGSGVGVVLMLPVGETLKYVVQIEVKATNNIAEYKGLVTGLHIAKTLGVRRLLIRGGSQLVAKQVQKEYGCNDERMAEYLAEARKMEKFFDSFEVRYIP